jgi:hypothetical protein
MFMVWCFYTPAAGQALQATQLQKKAIGDLRNSQQVILGVVNLYDTNI